MRQRKSILSDSGGGHVISNEDHIYCPECLFLYFQFVMSLPLSLSFIFISVYKICVKPLFHYRLAWEVMKSRFLSIQCFICGEKWWEYNHFNRQLHTRKTTVLLLVCERDQLYKVHYHCLKSELGIQFAIAVSQTNTTKLRRNKSTGP